MTLSTVSHAAARSIERIAVIASMLVLGACGSSAAVGPPVAPAVTCTEMGCTDSASITAALTPADCAPGVHAFAIDIDGTLHTCTVDFPPSSARPESGTCDDAMSLSLGPVMRSEEVRLPQMPDVVGITEVSVPGQFAWSLSIFGQPQTVHVVHTFEGRTISDRTATLAYENVRPNGPQCDPVCAQGTVAW